MKCDYNEHLSWICSLEEIKTNTRVGRFRKGVWRPRVAKVNTILHRCSFFIVQQREAFFF